MDLRKLKTLIDLVSESNVSELEITEAEGKVRIVKSGGNVMPQYVAAPMAAPMPVARDAVGYSSGVYAYNADQAPRLKKEMTTLHNRMEFVSKARLRKILPMPATPRNVTAIFFLPTLSRSKAAM